MDLDRLRAIAVHPHAEVSADGHDPRPPHLREAAQLILKDNAARLLKLRRD